MAFTDRIRAAADGFERGEAAWLLACRAHDAADWSLLADALDLGDATCRWDIARTARAVLSETGAYELFSANRLRRILPLRAHPLIPGTLKALALEGLIASTSQTERSTAPGARGWRVALYTLTPAGITLAAGLAPSQGSRAGYLQQLLKEAV